MGEISGNKKVYISGSYIQMRFWKKSSLKLAFCTWFLVTHKYLMQNSSYSLVFKNFNVKFSEKTMKAKGWPTFLPVFVRHSSSQGWVIPFLKKCFNIKYIYISFRKGHRSDLPFWPIFCPTSSIHPFLGFFWHFTIL